MLCVTVEARTSDFCLPVVLQLGRIQVTSQERKNLWCVLKGSDFVYR